MAEHATPRRMVKAILKGEQPPRPLLMPIIFSLGSRLENLPLRDFQANPTKIVNALRQVRGVLKVDGLACYFDPFLEVEALGFKLDWQPDGTPSLARSQFSGVSDLRKRLCPPDEIASRGRVPVAAEVLRRLKVMLKDEPALMVGVTGPLTLATQIIADRPPDEDSPRLDLLEFAAEATASVSRHFVEAGADVVFLVEHSLSEISPGAWNSWSTLLEPIINVIRFYEALPVVLCDPGALRQALPTILSRDWECVVCVAAADAAAASGAARHSLGQRLGLALPTDLYGNQEETEESVAMIASRIKQHEPTLLTSLGDIPTASLDLKNLTRILSLLRSHFLAAD